MTPPPKSKKNIEVHPDLARRRFSTIDQLVARIDAREQRREQKERKAEERRLQREERQRKAEEKRRKLRVTYLTKEANRILDHPFEGSRDDIPALEKNGMDITDISELYGLNYQYVFGIAKGTLDERRNNSMVARYERAKTVACPECGAAIGEPCVSTFRKDRRPLETKAHDERQAIAPKGVYGRPKKNR